MAKGLLAILGKPKLEGGDEDLGSEAKRQAARDFLAAVKADDADALVGAYKALKEACEEEYGEGDDLDEE